MAILFVLALSLQGRPFIYASERMRSPERAFRLYKIRTMEPVDDREAEAVLGGDQAWRVTPLGKVLRRTRLDELPQIFNVLRGDMAFIGPRPPLRRYVEDYPEVYRDVLSVPPGVTGLATVLLHRREERLLRRCATRDETDRVYRTACIPMKARLDRLYRERRSVGLDLFILWMTFAKLLPRRKSNRARKILLKPAPVARIYAERGFADS